MLVLVLDTNSWWRRAPTGIVFRIIVVPVLSIPAFVAPAFVAPAGLIPSIVVVV